MVPPRRPPRLLVPRDVTETARQGQGIGDIEAIKQMATRAVPEVLGMAPVTGELMSLYDAGKAASEGDVLGTGLGLAGAIPFAGTVAKVGSRIKRPIVEAVERVPTLWHGTSSPPFPKFLREFFGKGSGGNRLGLGAYGTTEMMPEGIGYLKAQTDGAPSSLVTKRGSEIEIAPEVATQLRSGDVTVEGYIDALKNRITQNEELAINAATPSLRQKAADRVEESRSKLYKMLTAYDEGVSEIRRPGTLLELAADVDPQKLLHYDKDLVDQPPFVQDAMRSILGIRGSISPRRPDQMFDFNRFLRKNLPEAQGTAKLESAGVQGVVARSPMSLSKADNYSIFNPDRVSILRTLGLAGLLTGGASLSRQEEDPSNRMR